MSPANRDWLAPQLALAARHVDAGEEVFLAPAVRSLARGDKPAVSETRFLWVDVDPKASLRCGRSSPKRPCRLLIESSAGHAHAYWKLDRPLPATLKAPRRTRLSHRGKTPVCVPWLPTCRAVHMLGSGHVDSWSWAPAPRQAQ